jgi:hypothetical protein
MLTIQIIRVDDAGLGIGPSGSQDLRRRTIHPCNHCLTDLIMVAYDITVWSTFAANIDQPIQDIPRPR